MKLTKSQIKELIRHSIRELTSEREDVTESKKRRFTVKEVRMWMKKLEENRYKKVYNSDARRVAWMVNNEGRTLDEMPISMKKKWTKAQYGRERYLATEFLKSKSEQMNESVWSLPKGATTTSVDELDAELSRAGIKSNPDFTKLLVQVSGNKSKINKIMKTHKAKKIFEGLDLKKLETAIKDFQKKIKKQGRVTNARDEDHLEQLIKVYKQMGGKKIKEGKLSEAIKKVSDAEDGAGFRQDWIGIYKGKFIQFKANFPVDAKKHTINYFKVPKSKYSEVVVISKKEYDIQQKLKVEQKLRESIREIIEEQMNEKSFGDIRKIKFDKKDGKKIANIITSKKYKLTTPLYKIKGKDIELHIPKKEYNKAVEFFMKNKLNPRG